MQIFEKQVDHDTRIMLEGLRDQLPTRLLLCAFERAPKLAFIVEGSVDSKTAKTHCRLEWPTTEDRFVKRITKLGPLNVLADALLAMGHVKCVGFDDIQLFWAASIAVCMSLAHAVITSKPQVFLFLVS